MKYQIEIVHDGTLWIAFSASFSGCFVQSAKKEELAGMMQQAMMAFRQSFTEHNEPFAPDSSIPSMRHHLTFRKMSANQLVKILKMEHYRVDHSDEQFLIFRNIEFPFNRVLVPNSNKLSPVIIRKIFGERNVTILSDETEKAIRVKAVNDRV
jgi:hypothetical protein